ncbi:MAG TPA: glycosyltransferase [Longimicrobiales bacterium]|nr:glycosyltransferase [Longimicrobiales bacterium]
MNGHAGPLLSVIIPVHNGAAVLPRCLSALESSSFPGHLREVLVVDDGGTDGAAEHARLRGHPVLRVPGGPRGPGHARNLGADAADGAVLVFVDADVCVHPDVLDRFAGIFEANPDVAAAFGAYDDRPGDPGFLSQYRNLYHRYVHLRGAGEAETFWAGCGAVRKEVFRALGGFDTRRYPRPQIEDIELGYRIRDAGHRILLDPGIAATHLKQWTLPGMLRTDLLDRGIPWMRLLLERPRPGNLNVGAVERLRTALVGLAGMALLTGAVTGSPEWLLVSAALLILNVASNTPLYRWLADQRGWWFAVRAIPVNLLYYAIAGLSVVVAATGHAARRVPGGSGSPRSRPSAGLGSHPAGADVTGSNLDSSRDDR